jgi:hypothetical protein
MGKRLKRSLWLSAGLWLGGGLLSVQAVANDVLPRLFNNVPIDVNLVSFSYVRSQGNVSVDPSLALDVEATLDTFSVSYTRTFALFGQSAGFTVGVPYADLELTGIVQGEQVTARGDEFPDPKFRLAMNLAGAPALTLEEMAGYRQKTIIGFNLEVTPPLGDYDETRRVNFGSNRWTVAPELGFSHRFQRFSLEGAAAVVFFSDNTDYLVDSTLKQKPIGIVRANLIYNLRRPGTWLGLSALYLKGGETTVDGQDREDLQANSRVGLALSWPFLRSHNLLFKISSGVTTRIGADFDNYQLVYTYRF